MRVDAARRHLLPSVLWLRERGTGSAGELSKQVSLQPCVLWVMPSIMAVAIVGCLSLTTSKQSLHGSSRRTSIPPLPERAAMMHWRRTPGAPHRFGKCRWQLQRSLWVGLSSTNSLLWEWRNQAACTSWMNGILLKTLCSSAFCSCDKMFL